ncbi:uncharacterized protein LOC108629314, partial [Ceratina calcarata]|uniref:Uncharacterized protein LOC108629314 n=1 Tax=Ceratina calcarata TaxID=156304 RepID=A0AAJ7J920_9HYME
MGEKAEEILNQVLPQMSDATRIQQADESADSFMTALHTLAETCDYDTLKVDLIRDRLVIEVRDSKTSERLQLTPDLTLEKAITMARQAETQAAHGKLLRQTTEESDHNEINRISHTRNEASEDADKRDARGGNSSSKRTAKCQRCGFSQHQDYTKCPALRSTCRNCKKTGHWDRVCKSRSVRRLEETENDARDSAFL